jgi:hypothetical protein
MRSIRLFAAAVLLHTVMAAPGAAGTLTSRFDGRWRNPDNTVTLRWLDVRIVEGPKRGISVWWTCDAPGGCMNNGARFSPDDTEIDLSYNGPQSKAALRLAAAPDGTLVVQENVSYADGRQLSWTHRLRRWSAVPSAETASDLRISPGQAGVHTADNRGFSFDSPNSVHEPPRVNQQGRNCDPRHECGASQIGAPFVRPPYNPDDPNGAWLAQYNDLLRRILIRNVQPDVLNAYARSETDDPYDTFVKRSDFLNFIFQP